MCFYVILGFGIKSHLPFYEILYIFYDCNLKNLIYLQDMVRNGSRLLDVRTQWWNLQHTKHFNYNLWDLIF